MYSTRRYTHKNRNKTGRIVLFAFSLFWELARSHRPEIDCGERAAPAVRAGGRITTSNTNLLRKVFAIPRYVERTNSVARGEGQGLGRQMGWSVRRKKEGKRMLKNWKGRGEWKGIRKKGKGRVLIIRWVKSHWNCPPTASFAGRCGILPATLHYRSVLVTANIVLFVLELLAVKYSDLNLTR